NSARERRSRKSQRGPLRSMSAMKAGQSSSGCARRRIHKKYSTTLVSTSVPSTSNTASTSLRPERRSIAARTELVSALGKALPLGGQVVRHLCDARSERQALDDPLRRLNESQRGACPRRHLLAGGIGP